MEKLRLDYQTYLQDYTLDEKLKDRFAAFSAAFHLSDYSHRILTILQDDERLIDLMKDLVPTQLSETQFWLCYFFRLKVFDEEVDAHRLTMQQCTPTATESFPSLAVYNEQDKEEQMRTESYVKKPLSESSLSEESYEEVRSSIDDRPSSSSSKEDWENIGAA